VHQTWKRPSVVVQTAYGCRISLLSLYYESMRWGMLLNWVLTCLCNYSCITQQTATVSTTHMSHYSTVIRGLASVWTVSLWALLMLQRCRVVSLLVRARIMHTETTRHCYLTNTLSYNTCVYVCMFVCMHTGANKGDTSKSTVQLTEQSWHS
jgi:hypothetical protein